MTVLYMLDTNICIYIQRQRPEKVLARFQKLKPGDAAISVITWGELVYGAEKSKQRKKALQLLGEFKSFVPVLPIPESSGNTYGPSAHYWNPKERLLVTTICGSQHTQKRQLLRLLPTMKESFNACLV